MIVTEDHAVTAIESLCRRGQPLSYAWLKRSFGSRQISDEVYSSLDRGRAILTTVDQLDQYLFSYAPMVANQWASASGALVGRPGEPAERVIDYGCGQGLAGLLLSDHLGKNLFAGVRAIIAIEPSGVALRRAVAVYQALAPSANVMPINKDFDALRDGDLTSGEGDTTHIFSNVLDIDGYDHVGLLRRALTPGKHTIIAVGHDRTAHGFSQGLGRVKGAVDAGTLHPAITVQASDLTKYTVGARDVPAVLWLCKLEVSDG